MIVLSEQQGTGGIPKKEANALMAKFLEDRKQERLQESRMLVQDKAKEVDQAEEQLKSREFYGGNFFESMNPFKQVEDTGDLDLKMQSRVVDTFVQKTGFTYLQSRMKAIQRDVEVAMGVTRGEEEKKVWVWSLKSKPEFAFSMRHGKNVLFFVW